ncbi:hypothetical protein HDE_04903 [Halotydeus destructor]|nr:hypothetical protein HDE_04903 [Halotydeus destructor]
MKFTGVLVLSAILVGANGQLGGNNGSSVGPDYGQAMIRAMSDWTSNVQAINRVLLDLNSQWGHMVATSARLVSGQSTENAQHAIIPPASVLQQVLRNVAQLTQQFAAAQQVLTDISAQFTQIVATGTRLVSGQDSGVQNPIEALLVQINNMANQFTGAQRVLGELSGQLNRMVITGSRLVTGLQAEVPATGSGSPVDAISGFVSQLTAQFAAAQQVFAEINDQLSQMMATGSRLVTGLQADTPLPEIDTPATFGLRQLIAFTDQVQAIQRILLDMNLQFNRIIASSGRLVG